MIKNKKNGSAEIDDTEANGSFKYKPIRNEHKDKNVAKNDVMPFPSDKANVPLFDSLSPLESKIPIANTTEPYNMRNGIAYEKD